jgi:hypothetical protein
MSDGMGSDDLAGQLSDLGSEPDPEAEEGVVTDEGPKLSAFAQNYLNTVPDTERDMVQRHVQQWDKGFSKYAENIAKKYGQYDQLGEFEQVQQAVQLAQLITSDPQTATQWLISQGYGPQQAAQAVQNQQAQQQNPQLQNPQQPQQPQQEWIPPSVQRELQRYQMALGAMNQRFEQDQFNRETERYRSEIESGLAAVKQQHPGIPETMILHLMKGGMEMDEAVGLLVEQIQSGVNQRSAPQAPRVLSSASLPPQAAKAPSEMTDDERKASLLAALQGAME